MHRRYQRSQRLQLDETSVLELKPQRMRTRQIVELEPAERTFCRAGGEAVVCSGVVFPWRHPGGAGSAQPTSGMVKFRIVQRAPSTRVVEIQVTAPVEAPEGKTAVDTDAFQGRIGTVGRPDSDLLIFAKYRDRPLPDGRS